jgi:ABC-type lipoprotein release transport system permease subunit
MAMVAAGILAGSLGALWLTDSLGSLLHEVSTKDPVTFLLMPLLLASVSLFACWLPARRAAKVDPMVALRAE